MSDRVSLRDVYDVVGRLEGKIVARLDEQNKRIDNLETWRDRAAGVMLAISVFVSSAATYIWNIFMGKE